MEYRYKPPLKFLFIGFAYVIIAGIFALSIVGIKQIFVKLLVIFFFIVVSTVGIAYIFLYLKNYKSKKIILKENTMEVPHKWNKQIYSCKYSEIIRIEKYTSYTNIIEIYIQGNSYIIEQNWMKNKNEFINVYNVIFEKINKK